METFRLFKFFLGKSGISERPRLARLCYVSVFGLYALFSANSCQLSKSDHDLYLASPSGTIAVHLFTRKDDSLCYTVFNKRSNLIGASSLGINIDHHFWGCASVIKEAHEQDVSRDVSLRGREQSSHLSARKYRLSFHDKNGFTWFMDAIVSDKGYAFRYDIPGKGLRQVYSEKTSFCLAPQTKVWYFERDNSWKLKSYAGSWISSTIEKMPGVSKEGPIQGIPVVLQLKDSMYMAIAEAGCYDYSGMRLKAIGQNTFQVNFTEDTTGFSVRDEVVTPWRAILFADNLNDLANNTFIADVAPRPDSNLYADQSYIKPGKCIWRWWAKGTGDPRDEMSMVDKATALDVQYVLIDDGWEKWPDAWGKVKGICLYAAQKHIGVWLWKDSHALSRDSLTLSRWMDSVRAVGAVGVKVDFFNSQSKGSNTFQIAIIKAAARQKLMVDIHGCSAGTGEAYSFPNQLTREGIRGLELNKMKEGPITASHNAALPFTRFLMGPADYTPLGFTAPGKTSWAQQLATLVEFTSPFQVIAEDPDFLLQNPHASLCLPFLRCLPTTWDETIVLSGSKIGKFSAMARRSGDNWFIGIINAGGPRTYSLDLSFLKDTNYNYRFFQDDLKASKIHLSGLNKLAFLKEDTLAVPFRRESGSTGKGRKITIDLAKNGGFVAMLFPDSRIMVEK
jgi:alpha-glucosidase